MQNQERNIKAVARKVMLYDANDDKTDLAYWLTKSVQERAAALTFLISQSLNPNERMNKNVVNKVTTLI